MRVYLSKFVLLFMMLASLFLPGATGFFAWMSYQLGVRYDISLGPLLVLWSICALFLIASVFICRVVLRALRWRGKPIISFDENGLSYTRNYRDTIYTAYEEICGVELDSDSTPKGTKFYLQIRKTDLTTDRIFMNNLDTSVEKIFAEFKTKLPRLIQPNTHNLRLVQVNSI